MSTNRHVTLFHAPNSRSLAALVLVEELSAEHDLRVLNFKLGEQRDPAYLAMNPMGKVPALLHGHELVTEQAAVLMYLAELYPERALAPAAGEPLRGSYLRWMVFYGNCFEPAVGDRAMKRDPGPHMQSPYGDYESVVNTVRLQLQKGPWMLGETFTVADILWGTALGWISSFGLIEKTPALEQYVGRYEARPAVHRARERDGQLAAKLT